jgi:hypothetical protein
VKLLNVGGGSKRIPIPNHFSGWDHDLLDIAPAGDVDVVCNAVELSGHTEKHGFYDAVYCSHNLEHYHRHDLPKVLAGFKLVIHDQAFIEVHVPNMQEVFTALAHGKDIEDLAYVAPCGPIKFVDIVYGLGSMIEHSGNDFMSHKNGFTPKSLGHTLFNAGFEYVFVGANKSAMEIVAFAFKQKPSAETMALLKLKEQS